MPHGLCIENLNTPRKAWARGNRFDPVCYNAAACVFFVQVRGAQQTWWRGFLELYGQAVGSVRQYNGQQSDGRMSVAAAAAKVTLTRHFRQWAIHVQTTIEREI